MSPTDIALGYATFLLEGHNWWKWQWGYFMRSRRDIERLLKIGATLDPEAAAEEREKNAEYQRKSRAKKISEPQAMLDPVDRLRAAFAALEFAIHDVNDDDLRRVLNEIGGERVLRLVSTLKSALDPRRSAGVQSAADRAEARSKLHEPRAAT
jgi:hypothetical protein